MSCVHYKFSSKLDYNTVTFDGLHITLNGLKRLIMRRERLKATKGDLQITNAQTHEEYTDDEDQIPRHSSVIVRRIPFCGVKPTGRTFIVCEDLNGVRDWTQMWWGTIWALIFRCVSLRCSVNTFIICTQILLQTDSSPSMSLAELAKTANLVDANASEEDKIKAMMLQSNHEYDPIHYSKKAVGPPPAHYTCHRCGKGGHYIGQCPMLLDKNGKGPKPVRICKGIPQSFMVKAEPGTQGAMLTSTGEYAIPAIDAKAYAQGKKERPPFVPHEQSSSEDDADPIPDELLCPICNDLMTDAVVIPCCGNNYCDDCIRTALLDSEEHVCFTCKQSDVSPDNLIANKFLRQAVNNYKNETGCTKLVRKKVQQAALPPPRLQLSRPLHSRQQDPLLANVTHPPPASVPTAAPQTQVQPPAPSPPVPGPVSTAATATAPPHAAAVEGQDVSPAPAPVADQHSPMHSTGQGEPPLAGEMDPEPTVRRSPESTPEIGPHGYHFSVLGHPPPTRPPHPSGHQSRPHHSHRGGGRHWERSFRGRGDLPPAHLQTAPPPGPAPPVYPSPYLYPPPPHLYPPPYTSGLLPPPPFGYPPQPIYAPGPPGLNPPWIPPGVQPPLPHLGPPLSQPPLSKEEFYRQRHRQDKTTSKLDEFTKDFHKERMKYKNSPKRRRPSYSRSRHNGCSYGRSWSKKKPREESEPSHHSADSGGLLPISRPHGLPLLHRPPSPVDGWRRMGEEGPSLLGPPPGKRRRMGEEGRSLLGPPPAKRWRMGEEGRSLLGPPHGKRRRMGEEGRSILGPPPGKLRRIDGLGGCSDVLSHSHMSHQSPLHRLQLSLDRPLPGSREMIQGDADRGTIRPLKDLPMPLAQRRIKLNRDLGRKGSTETSASDRAPLGPEKMSSTSDRSASSSVSEGDRSNSTTEGAGRKELSASAERRASRERPGSAGERLPGSDREQDRVSGPDRDRDRVSGSDRDRGVGSERERERDRVSGSSSQKVAATAERDSDRERTTSNLNEFTIDFHKELMEYKNSPKRRRPSYSRSRSAQWTQLWTFTVKVPLTLAFSSSLPGRTLGGSRRTRTLQVPVSLPWWLPEPQPWWTEATSSGASTV
ncbi:E3 ubiquitin-protein ligase RBBP6-like [Hippoglossus hippoglossus]|uniref:E3 ubiquitin-protein ligase RBBP6-like n=1 Tax=Hippoglossus hippoglossus TaxID=8267 RepID=UPI00148C6ADB|nr:E3 ubiquitin-protein ligase RBBP6-like [Hippoglossus hippoglossus]